MFIKQKILFPCVLGAALIGLSGCSPAETIPSEPAPEQIAEYLYCLQLDSYSFEAMPAADSPMFTFGCSSVRKGSLYGRNLDLTYCETPEFIVRLSASEGRFASIGVCADPTITPSVGEMTKEQLLSMPNITNDGINENGVVVSVNIVNTAGVDDMTGTAPGRERLHASRVVRYLLDRAESAEHAVELMKNVDIVGGFTGMGLHWMIADAEDTYVVEILDGRLTVSRNEYYFMTNFYLTLGPVQEEQRIGGNVLKNVPLLNEYAIGVERWCLLREGYDGVSSEEDMVNLLASIRATSQYDPDPAISPYSEYCDGPISIHSTKEEFEEALAEGRRIFEARDRKNPQGDWITWHTSVYDIETRTLNVYSQEDYTVGYVLALAD